MAEIPSGQLIWMVALGLLVVVGAALTIYWMASREIFAPESENPETAAQRQEDKELRERGDWSIPLRSRVRSLSGAAKSVLAASGMFLVLLGYILYRFLQTGSPADEYLTLEVAAGIIAVGGIAAGYRLREWVEKRIGVMFNLYERPEGAPEVEKVEYLRSERMDFGDEEIIQQLHPKRLLGVFLRRMMVGNHRVLRSSPKPLSDVVTHSVPDGEHAVEVDEGLIINRTVGEPIYNRSPDAVADVSYRSPNLLSFERAVQLRQGKRRMQIERDAWKTTSAAKDTELERLSDMILNREWEDKTDLMELLREYEEMQESRETEVVDARDAGVTRSSQADGSSVLQHAEDGAGSSGGES